MIKILICVWDSLRLDAIEPFKNIFKESSWNDIPSLDGFTGPILPSICVGKNPEELGLPRTDEAFWSGIDPSKINDTIFDHIGSHITISRLIGNPTMPHQTMVPSRREHFTFMSPLNFNAVSNWEVDIWRYFGQKWSIANPYWIDSIFFWSFITHGCYSIYTSEGKLESPEISGGDRLNQRLARYEPQKLRKLYMMGVYNAAATLKGLNEICDGKELIICFSDHNECSPEGLILTNNGIIDISEIKVNDVILDSNGEWNKVNKIYKREYNGDLININIQGNTDKSIRLTPNHPVLCKNGYNKVLWKNASEIKLYDGRKKRKERGDKLLLPIPKKSDESLDLKNYIDNPIECDNNTVYNKWNHRFVKEKWNNRDMISPTAKPLPRDMSNEDFLILCGLYISEGSLTKHTIWISGNMSYKAQECANKLNLGGAISQEEGKCSRCCINSKLLTNLFKEWFGHDSKYKKLPTWVYALSNDKLKILIDYIWFGDGTEYVDKRGNRSLTMQLKTTSRILAYQLQSLLTRLGYSPNLNSGIYDNEIDGYHSHGIYYLVRYVPNSKKKRNINNGQYLEMKVRNVQIEKYNGYVYNFDVENSHTYTINNISVHNCLGEEYNGQICTGHFHGMEKIPGLERVPIWCNKSNVKFPENMKQTDIKDWVKELFIKYELENESYQSFKQKKLQMVK